ncbi:DUF423 domain-containing protein [Wenyingzhuangia sp. 2_MG-2023]|uniref:DUF423 domain-containing protein n=1 Tax=Wenyingzhuangia sp. 2_MG-2023 TaxID=3062639 RepID=UPI0026E2FD14|nr:DUF423 domain-containing protein [Wenyingzhuangia sp. 2_MG-2023]MDO6739176.1 DUF423 domain-containing protein [Wenyingzhuangia sp. 2_MG-2023]
MQQIAYLLGGIFGLLAIVLGAFGSHLLKKKWSKDILDSFEIGVKYQMYHALFLVLLGSTLTFNSISSTLSVIFAILGIFLFSGSIYGICSLKSRELPVKFLGPITPLGGLCLLLSWLFFLLAVL